MYLSLKDLLTLVPISKSSIYRAMREDNFPSPVKVGGRALWSELQVKTWLDHKNAAGPNMTSYDIMRFCFVEGFEEARMAIEFLVQEGVPPEEWVARIKAYESGPLREWGVSCRGTTSYDADAIPLIEAR